MNEIKSIKISPVCVSLKVGEWYYGAKLEIYPNTIKSTNIVWSSDKQNIATVNPVNGYVYAHNPGIAIITAKLVNEETVTACYTIFVENNGQINSDTVSSNKGITNGSSTRMAVRSDCGSYSDAAFGYSGTLYSYNITGNTATLEKGTLSKTKTYNYYAGKFQSAVYNMAVIYDSFSPLQRQAWLVLRAYGVLTAFSFDVIDTILLLAGVDLKGQLEATVLRMNEWYRIEEQAKSYYSLF